MTDKAILERIRRNAEAALKATKSARTQSDVSRFIQQVIDGINVELALTSDQPNVGVDVGKAVERFLAWPIPPSVVCDPCMTDAKYKFPRSGTCIMGPAEAQIMFEHCLFPIQPPRT
jgi:hypothetical protein